MIKMPALTHDRIGGWHSNCNDDWLDDVGGVEAGMMSREDYKDSSIDAPYRKVC